MNRYTVQHIEPLIADIQEHGRSLQVVFECPVSGTRVSSRATAARNNSASSQASSKKPQKDQ